MRAIVLIWSLALIPSILTAQQWQSMEGPYFIYNVTGISFGWTDFGQPEQQMHAYAVGSDLEYEYIYDYHGDSPIARWQPGYPIAGVKHVSASRYEGIRGYATVPEGGLGTPGVRQTFDGESWSPTISQPGNLRFTGITAHPGNANICFTTSEQDSPNLSVWRTTDAGLNWSSLGGQGIPDPTITSNSLRIDPNSGNSIGTTTIYACYDQQGIWKSTDGGSDWVRMSVYGTDYDGLDIAVKDGDEDNVYALVRHEGDYEIWHSTNGGSSWGILHTFNDNIIRQILVDDVWEFPNYYDALWIIGDDYMYIYHGNHGVGPFSAEHGRFLAGDSDPNLGDDFDNLYLASTYSIQVFGYSAESGGYQINDEEIVQGTNKLNTISIDACQGGYLRMIGLEGGYVVKNLDATEGSLQGRSEWKTDDYFQRFTETGLAYGNKISSYLNDEAPSYIASGTIGSSPYLIDTGIEVYMESRPSNINAVTGPHYPTTGYTEAFAAGQNSSFENTAWFVQRLEPYPFRQLVELLNLSPNPPVIRDIIHELEVVPNYYICGSRTSDLETIAAYVLNNYPDPSMVISLNSGLGDPYHVSDASSIVRSNEIDAQTGIYILYLGTEKGIFKNRFDLQPVAPPWYHANYGIGANVEITAIANYYHILKNWPYGAQEPKPDSVIQYALGYDLSGQPFIYVSPDSGRSWNEIGQFFRDNNIAANDITTFTDVRETSLPTRSFLGVGTDNGVYKLPYNVRSGEITGNEIWDSDFYIINRDLIIPEGSTLTIGPNTTVLVLYDYPSEEYEYDKLPIVVNGSLTANGVTFKSSRPINPQPGDWQGIIVGDQGVLTLVNCVIEDATDAIMASAESHVEMMNCTIANSDLSGITANYPSYVNISYTQFTNNNLYAISIMNLDAIVELRHLEINGINRYGIRYFGKSPDPLFPLIDSVTIIYYQGPNEPPPPFYGIEFDIDEVGYRPMGRISDVTIAGYEDGIHLSNTIEGIQIGPNVFCGENVNGILLDNAWAEIDGSEGLNIFENNEIRGLLSYYSAGKVRYSNFIGSPLCVDIEKDGDVIDFGLDDPEEEWGNNSFIAMEGGSEMLLYVSDCGFNYPAMMNWWGSDDNGYIESMVSECVLWDPFRREPPPPPKLTSEEIGLPNNLTLSQVYPNPFNANVTIKS